MFSIGNKEEFDYELDKSGVNNLRGLALDMIVNRESGHTGITLGAATILYTLFKYHMNIDINNLDFINRDRFVFSAGHGVPLLYAIDYFLGLLSLDDLKNFRRIGSKTPGHPEVGVSPLGEVSTGLLGEGVATAVGISLANNYLKAKTNGVVDYYTYVLCGDGELEEGITYESLALAGTWNLKKFIVLVDLNENTLDDSLMVTSNENLKKRFESINFNILESLDDVKSINEAIIEAKKANTSSVIFVHTKIGLYTKYEGTNLAHGNVISEEELFQIKEKLGLHPGMFNVSDSVVETFKTEIETRGNAKVLEFQKKYKSLKNKEFIDKIINKDNIFLLNDLDFSYDNKSLRELSGIILNKIGDNFDLLIGGSADLSSSCKTKLINESKFLKDNYIGRNINFGIRENAMGAIINGISLLGFRPFASTFLSFSDYLKPSLRMSALMNLPVIYIFTHDSITTGEDGPTHQPIEQLVSLEAIPNLKVYRPFDFNELIGCYMDILKHRSPSCLILPRDSNDISENTKINGIEAGIYEVIKNDTDEYINLISSGEELGIVLKVSKNLKELGIDNRVFSIPCTKNIKANLDGLWKEKRTIGITLSSPWYLYKFTHEVIGVDKFGSSGSKEEMLLEYGFTEETLQSKILELLNKEKNNI